MIARFITIAAAGMLGVALAAAPSLAQKAGGQVAAGPALAANEPAPANTTSDSGTSETAEALTSHGDGVAAIVNDTVISQYDLRQRMALFLSTSGVKATADAAEKIRPQVLKQLETERLQLLEAQKKNITVSSAEVDKAIQGILDDNHMSKEQLTALLAKDGVHVSTLRAQITAQIAWSKLVQDQYGDRVDISPEDVNAELARISEGANKPHFQVAEIFQAVDTPEQDSKVLKDVEELESQIHLGAPFSAVARQFSQSPTAAQGGDLGWITEGQLTPELDKVLAGMHTGEVSAPIRSAGGYYILFLRQRQEPAGTKVPTQPVANTGPQDSLPLARVLLPIGPNPPKQLRDNAFEAAKALRERINDCSILPELAKALHGSVFQNLGTMKLAELSQDIRTALADTVPGEPTQPFFSAAGIEIIVRCDKAAPVVTAFQMPTHQQIEEQLMDEQLSVLARRYMRDLRRDADVESRDEIDAEDKHAKIN